MTVAVKENTLLLMNKRMYYSFKSKDVIRLYKAVVKQKLEFCVQAWCPHIRKDFRKGAKKSY